MAPRLIVPGADRAGPAAAAATAATAAREVPVDHALEVLEFTEVLEAVARLATGAAGADRVRRLRPVGDRAQASGELDAVEEVRAVLEREGGWELGPIPEVDDALRRLALAGATLLPGQLRACAVLLSTARAARRILDAALPEAAVARSRLTGLEGDRPLEERILASIDEDGSVADEASPELRRVRRQLAGARSRLVGRLESFAASLPERVRVPDGSVTVRSGRYCIPIRREGKSAVGGLVHDASASRQTLFVEPPLAIEAMNDIRELEIAERREIDRVLEELSERLRARGERVAASASALATLDSLRARARFAMRVGGVRPELAPPDADLHVREGRHPLLVLDGAPVVPFDLSLSPGERVLLISGPNAGGKTVVLKSVGLLAALAQAGIVPPVGAGSRFPCFRRIYAVIGDEQSIHASLSTFGAQMRNLAAILESAERADLVLLDEIGSATDPAEGAALAAAALHALARRARLTVATSHLGDLKALAEEDPSIVNASLQFDVDRLEPTYRLLRDRPGRSYALEIAARLGVPAEVLAEARNRLAEEHRTVDGLLERLERDQAELETMRERLLEMESRLGARLAKLEEREARAVRRDEEIATRERRLAEEGARAVEAMLKAARSEVDAVIERLEEGFAAAGDEAGRREATRAARSGVERALREARGVAESEARPPRPTGERPTPGQRVRWGDAHRTGRLVEVRSGRAVVDVDGIRLTLPLEDLRLADPASDPTVAAAERPEGRRPDARVAGGDARRPDFEVRSEIDLRGLRVEEVAGALIPALDAACMAELPWLRIIHGKGTGALRSAVETLLSDDPRSLTFRPGQQGEGGVGVTVVEFP